MKVRVLLASLSAAAVVPALVSAGPITTGTVNVAYSHDAVVTIDRPVGPNISVYAGTATISAVTGGLSPYLPASFVSFCVDLYENLGSNPLNVALDTMNNWNLANGQPPPQAGRRASYLYQTFVPTLSLANTAAAKVSRAGLQVAIWNALYDSDHLASSGIFSATSSSTPGVITAANNYLAALQTAETTSGISGYNNFWLQMNNSTTTTTTWRQDFIGTRVPDGGATLGLLGGAIIALGALRRKLAR